MRPSPNLDVEQLIIRLLPESTQTRRSALLRPLNNSVILLSIAGLFVMLVIGGDPYAYAIIGLSLALNLLTAWLDRTNRTTLAVNLFTHWINLGIIGFTTLNLFVEQNLTLGLVFAAVLAMSVILAGMLLSSVAAFGFAISDSLAIFTLLFFYFSYIEIVADETPLRLTLSLGVPVAAFLILIAVVSWLYQRALALAELRLNEARERIVRDELLRRDMAVARELQQRLYPPPPLTNPGLRIASRSLPARETSGDFYDFIELDGDRMGLVVADVTGKSIAAALVMAMARSTLRSEATRHHGPADVLTFANTTLCQDRSVKQMITTCYGVLDTRTLDLRISNAGHPFPVLRRNGALEEIEICGLPLGARVDASYAEVAIQLQPGDQLVILSDGLIEERNASRELFGFDRLASTIAAADPHDPERALDQIWQAVEQFRGALEQSDDITLVVIQVAL